ncbi:MAG: hypothetical protein ACKPKO_00185 [Candidatus Fonsibacter sp.]
MSAGSISTTGNISAGSVSTTTGNITTASGNISSTSGNIQTINGTITGKHGSFQNLAVTGSTVKPAVPTSVGVYIGLDSGNTAGGIEICTSTLQYIDFYLTRSRCKKGVSSTGSDLTIFSSGIAMLPQQR